MADLFDILLAKNLSGGGGGGGSAIAYTYIVDNGDNTITATDDKGVEHTIAYTIGVDGKITSVTLDGKTQTVTYDGDVLVKIGNTDVDIESVPIVETGLLPAEYQEVEYIESTGTQYIILNWNMTEHEHIICEFQGMDEGDYKSIWGRSYGGSRSIDEIGFLLTKSEGKMYLVRNNSLQYFNYDWNSHSLIGYLPEYMTVNGVKYSFGSHTSNNPIALFGSYDMSTSSVTPTKTRIMRFIRFENSSSGYFPKNFNPISNLVPCYRKSDNVIGLYDTITETFLTNSGTGIFLKGADVNE